MSCRDHEARAGPGGGALQGRGGTDVDSMKALCRCHSTVRGLRNSCRLNGKLGLIPLGGGPGARWMHDRLRNTVDQLQGQRDRDRGLILWLPRRELAHDHITDMHSPSRVAREPRRRWH